MSLVVVAVREERLVRGDERNGGGIRKIDQGRFNGAFRSGPVTLELHIEPPRIQRGERVQPRPGQLRPASRNL